MSVFSSEIQSAKQKTEITGKQMVIKNAGEKTIFKGNAKIVRGSNTITADNMVYYKKTNNIDANGNIKFAIKNDDGSIVNAMSQKAVYNIKNYSGKLWDGSPVIKYNIANSTDTIFLYADTIELNKNFESVKAQDNVKIISSSGIITSDNALLNRQDNSLIMTKDKNKPAVDVKQDDKEAHFKADEISLFYDTKTVQMKNNVEGKIIMENINNLEIKQ
jgi:lipopolysaccharide export system protein LptA